MFLQILDAERHGDITLHFHLDPTVRAQIVIDLQRAYLNDFDSEQAEAWNALRREIIETALDEHLLPFGARWLRDHITEEVQDYVAWRCGDALFTRVDAAPYSTAGMEKGQVPNVVAISHGAGDPKRDMVHVVFLDAEGHLREQFQVDNLRPTNPRNPDGDAYREQLTELLIHRRPQVVVLGGTTPTTNRLASDVAGIVTEAIPKIAAELAKETDDDGDLLYKTTEEATRTATIETIFVNDEVARIYQHSKRAKTEYAELPTIGKYCIALARFVQSPVTEYAALGKDLTALTFDPSQKHVRRLLLYGSYETGLRSHSLTRRSSSTTSTERSSTLSTPSASISTEPSAILTTLSSYPTSPVSVLGRRSGSFSASTPPAAPSLLEHRSSTLALWARPSL